MATATVAAPMSLETLAANVEKLLGELRAVKAKRDAEKQKLAQLETERASLGTLFARDSATADDVARNTREIEIAKAKLTGFDSLVDEAQRLYDTPCKELQQRKRADADARTLAEIGELENEAQAIIAQIVLTLSAAGSDVRRYEEVRRKLGEAVNQAMGGRQFPIPAPAARAHAAISAMDKSITEQLAPLLKLFKR